MEILDLTANIILGIIKQPYITIFIASGYLTYSKPIFARSLYLMAFTMIFNAFLKSLWQIPLNPALNIEGWAFPSGHMQVACAFWGWLAYEFDNKKFRCTIAVLLIAFGLSLIHFDYHNLNDVVAAAMFAILEIMVFRIIISKIKPQEQPLVGLLLSGVGWLLISLLPKTYPHTWLAQGILMGFSLGYWLNENYIKQSTNNFKLYKLTICFIGAAIIAMLSKYLPYQQKYQAFIGYFAISFWISFAADFIVYKFLKN